ncbi:hypothetical protein [Mesorhizobium sp. B2-4-14]|uniref:cytidine deaminase family protein n=1 Tax=Mesorhizobium sp. B2-4-14 TaxID=2589935 RepID=UPI0015E2E61B|nr:hypothetical protein [Mesorhizobium sp. B2-4-14]
MAGGADAGERLQKTSFDRLSSADQALVTAAAEARDKAYTPYSNHKVGSAVRTASGRLFSACNVEIVTLQQSVHAERNAVSRWRRRASGRSRPLSATAPIQACHAPNAGR